EKTQLCFVFQRGAIFYHPNHEHQYSRGGETALEGVSQTFSVRKYCAQLVDENDHETKQDEDAKEQHSKLEFLLKQFHIPKFPF
ncbi:MAG: hypothetical protein PHW41_02565, partial [Eubacteriales bacterium]|nr:hypothetical protein [Eubacteriales bacterium]